MNRTQPSRPADVETRLRAALHARAGQVQARDLHASEREAAQRRRFRPGARTSAAVAVLAVAAAVCGVAGAAVLTGAEQPAPTDVLAEGAGSGPARAALPGDAGGTLAVPQGVVATERDGALCLGRPGQPDCAATVRVDETPTDPNGSGLNPLRELESTCPDGTARRLLIQDELRVAGATALHFVSYCGNATAPASSTWLLDTGTVSISLTPAAHPALAQDLLKGLDLPATWRAKPVVNRQAGSPQAQ